MILELSQFSQLWTTGYGQMLLVKTGIFSALLVIGWMNRSRLVPGLAAAVGMNPLRVKIFRRLRRNMALEIALLLAVIAAVSILTDLRPGR